MVHSIRRPIEFRNRTWFEDKYRSEVLAMEREVQEFVGSVRRFAEQAQRVHVVFNNNLKDQGYTVPGC